MNLLLVDITQYILPGVFVVMIIALFVMNYVRNKKFQEKSKDMLSNLKKGDKIKTYSGIYGKIVEMKETIDGKMVTIETGSGKRLGYFTIDVNAVYGIVDDSAKAVVEEKPTEIEETATQEVEPIKETITEEKPIAKAEKKVAKTSKKK